MHAIAPSFYRKKDPARFAGDIAWHMPRSVKLFEAQGLEVIPLPTDYNVTPGRLGDAVEPVIRAPGSWSGGPQRRHLLAMTTNVERIYWHAYL